MQIKVFRFTGLTPLLMANVESIGKKLPALKLGTTPNKGDIETIAEAMAYRDDDGALYMPTQALRSSLLDGCKGQKFPGSRVGPRTIFQATVFQSEDRATLLDANGKPIKDYEVKIDSGVNTSTKARIIVVRACVPDWRLEVPFEVDDEFAPSNYDEFLEALTSVWNRAGRAVGIGAWRPEKQGRFGRYSVEMVS